ncbi:MAG: FAD-dependent oxidoreductase [Candidatus Thorarchaeota archaeon]
MSQAYDVAVVGSGPAGSTSARVSAENGLRTLMIDRRKTIGIPIQCGELIQPQEKLRTSSHHQSECLMLFLFPRNSLQIEHP